jgi:uncharacterized LabA/DUF88 family protein
VFPVLDRVDEVAAGAGQRLHRRIQPVPRLLRRPSASPHWRSYRWLDLDAFCGNLCRDATVNRIRYFTALVDPYPGNPDNRARQLTYLRALATISHLSIHYGRFATNEKERPLAVPNAPRPTPITPLRLVRIVEREEKGSDVNLASCLLLDAFRQESDLAVVVSNDSDLAEPIRLVRSEFGLKVRIVNPRKFLAYDLRGIADFYSNVKLWMVRQSQFPPSMTDAVGTFSKPARW